MSFMQEHKQSKYGSAVLHDVRTVQRNFFQCNVELLDFLSGKIHHAELQMQGEKALHTHGPTYLFSLKLLTLPSSYCISLWQKYLNFNSV